MRTTLDIDDEVLTRPAGHAASEPDAFCGFRPFSAAGRLVSDETIERLREDEGI